MSKKRYRPEEILGKLREADVLREIFYTLREAKFLIEVWRRHYNGVRPHSALGYQLLAPEAIAWPKRREIPIETLGELLY